MNKLFQQILLPSPVWCELSGTFVLDPDGWDRSGANFQKDWNKPITFKEFREKAVMSTTRMDIRSEELIEANTVVNLRQHLEA